jgi:DNA-binding MarR family transcriptional regulator
VSEQAVSEQAAAGLPYGVPACRNSWDEVDRVLADWAGQRPDLDFTPVGVVTRLSRLRGYLDAELAGVFARFGLTSADFLVIVSLRRGGPPYRMPQARLMDALGLTSGTVSVRLDRLEKNGIVTREPDPASARGSLVQLTEKGLELFDRVAPVHLANEDRLLSALSPAEREVLAGLLRRLLSSFESGSTDVAASLGLALEPARLARARRQAVGLSDRAGLLVAAVAPGGPGYEAGIERGDLLISLDGVEVVSSTGLALLLENLLGRTTVRAVLLRGDEELTAWFTMPAAAGE